MSKDKFEIETYFDDTFGIKNCVVEIPEKHLGTFEAAMDRYNQMVGVHMDEDADEWDEFVYELWDKLCDLKKEL